MALGELIFAYDTLNQGRIKINNFYSGTSAIWSSSTGVDSVIRNNAVGNLGNAGIGTNSMAAGVGNRASANYALAFWGSGNTATTSFSTVLNGNRNQTNGLGGTVVGGGYNNISSGSYGVILNGRQNLLASTYGVVGGFKNSATTSANITILGGRYNVASGNMNFIGGGQSNTASTSNYVAIIGGSSNVASGTRSFIAGSQISTATTQGSIVGGIRNIISAGTYSFIGGGSQNNSTATSSVVAGGYRNSVRGTNGFIGGGRQGVIGTSVLNAVVLGGSGNTTNGNYTAVIGGKSNKLTTASAAYSFIGGGKYNQIGSVYGANTNGIIGGVSNTISTYAGSSFIGGGRQNLCIWKYSTVLGGRYNNIAQTYSTVFAGKGCTTATSFAAAMGGGAQTRANFSLVIGNQNTSVSNPANNTISLSGSVGYVVAEGGFQTATADYAEYFEWKDNNPNAEDRKGYFVSLDGDKIEIGNSNIIGIISSAPGFIGDTAEHRWSGMYIKDDWNNTVYEKYRLYSWTDDKGNGHTAFQDKNGKLYKEYPHSSFPKGLPYEGNLPRPDMKFEEFQTPKMNENYDPSNGEYRPRSERKEWAPVGLLGKLHVRTAEPITSKYIDVNSNGLAVNGTKYHVLTTIRPHTSSQYGIVKIFFRG